ncbi:MAG: DUF3108 domain-containing protein [Candidatus Zixiibacteriota bacterium]|nr:MAG: DUF3108 domain-containing protein [candidate division Zixibacteria bacterium]
MRKKLLVAVVIVLVLVCGAYYLHVTGNLASAQTESDNLADDGGVNRYIENNAFGLGEKLSYDIGYGFINAGYATMQVVDLIEYNDRPCYLIQSTANSNKFFSSFYRVEDRVESVVDAVGIFSWYFEKNLQEGSYHSNRSYAFDQINNVVIYKGDTIDVAKYVQDALSILYYARTQELEIGKSIYIENFTDGKKYALEVRVLRAETVKVKAGRFDCIVVEPLMQTSGIFKHEGKLTVWLTSDRLKMPVLMKSKVIVGSISAELTDYELGEILDF